ncbi:MAG: T9SS type A sorting domain-containing protein [Bacteroidales bacterium]|nr:T9SS type A sorting domain-containing protein [Bacteroidales bacterium]
MSVNDHGWVFRGETGDQPRVYDSIFLGNYQEASVMTFFYDSTLDLHRQRPCPGVDSLWCDRTAGYTVTLSWRSQFDHSGYELAYVPESGNWDDATVIETADTTLAVTLLDNQCHLFRVRGICDGNRAAHSPWSDVITVCPQVGISEVDGYCAISLYPNPATNMVRVESKKHKLINDEILLIEVFSMNGQKVLTQETSSQFDVSRLSNGTYIVKVVTTSNDYEYLKLIKQ